MYSVHDDDAAVVVGTAFDSVASDIAVSFVAAAPASVCVSAAVDARLPFSMAGSAYRGMASRWGSWLQNRDFPLST